MALGFPTSIVGESGKLDGSNYALWKFKVRNILVVRKPWSVVEGKLKKPTEMETKQDVIAEWEDSNVKAFAIIGMTVVDEVIPHI